MPSPFKAMLARHAGAAFLNREKFGGTLSVNGRAVTAMWDDTERPGGNGEAMYGVNVERRLLLALAADMPARPMPGQELLVDEAYWTVGPVRDCDGIYEIDLSRNLS